MKLTKQRFGNLSDGQTVEMFSLENASLMRANIINYGGIVTNIYVPDRAGNLSDVVLGYDALQGYLNGSSYFGAIVGRYANRIAQGKFVLNGKTYSLARNDGENHLHGGWRGFDKVFWEATSIKTRDVVGVELSYLSRDGEEGYPGNLRVVVRYVLTETNELRIDYQAATDTDTIVNLTNHSYFNLAGRGTILDHELMIEADSLTPVRAGLIPTGEIQSVAGTPMDFRSPMEIGARIHQDDEQLKLAGGYDHNFVLRRRSAQIKRAARVHHRQSGRVLEVFTTQPGLQFYSGNFLDGSERGKGSTAYEKHAGFCLETQHFPDSPNHAAFPSTVLPAGSPYHEVTVFRFSVE